MCQGARERSGFEQCLQQTITSHATNNFFHHEFQSLACDFSPHMTCIFCECGIRCCSRHETSRCPGLASFSLVRREVSCWSTVLVGMCIASDRTHASRNDLTRFFSCVPWLQVSMVATSPKHQQSWDVQPFVLGQEMEASFPFQDAWTRAKMRYIEDLNEEEKQLYYQATPETLFYDASAAQKKYTAQSTTFALSERLQPLREAIAQYGQALDVYSNAYPLVLSPIWGSIRVVLHVSPWSHRPVNSKSCSDRQHV